MNTVTVTKPSLPPLEEYVDLLREIWDRRWLTNKGHFREGADADVTVLDLASQQPVMAIANGQVIMHKGFVCGVGGRVVTTATGVDYVREKGLTPLVVDLAHSGFYQW